MSLSLLSRFCKMKVLGMNTKTGCLTLMKSSTIYSIVLSPDNAQKCARSCTKGVVGRILLCKSDLFMNLLWLNYATVLYQQRMDDFICKSTQMKDLFQ